MSSLGCLSIFAWGNAKPKVISQHMPEEAFDPVNHMVAGVIKFMFR